MDEPSWEAPGAALSAFIKIGKGTVTAACGLAPTAVVVLVNSCSCRTWPFVLSLAKTHRLVERAGGVEDHLAFPQWTGFRGIDVLVTEGRS